MTKNPFRGMKLHNRATAKLLRSDLNSDFKVTGQGLDAITNNLLTTQGSLGNTLSDLNQRSLAGMARLTGKDAKKLNHIVNKGESVVRNRYGSAIAGTPNLFGDAQAVQTSQRGAMKGQTAAARLTAKGSNEAMDILKQAGQVAMDSGQYELAMALRDRGEAAEEVIAANQTELAEKRFDYRQEQAAQKKDENQQRLMAAEESLLNMAMEPSADQAAMRATAAAMERTYHLKPGSLTSYVGSLFNAEGESTVAGPLLDADGNVIQTEADEDDLAGLSKATVDYLKAAEAEGVAPTKEAFISSIVGVTDEGKPALIGPDGTAIEVNGSYADSMREAAAAKYDAAAPAFADTSRVIAESDEEAEAEQFFSYGPFGAISWGAAELLSMNDGDMVDLDTALSIAAIAFPVEKLVTVPLKAGASLLGKAGLKVAEQGAATAAKTTAKGALSSLAAKAAETKVAATAAIGGEDVLAAAVRTAGEARSAAPKVAEAAATAADDVAAVASKTADPVVKSTLDDFVARLEKLGPASDVAGKPTLEVVTSAARAAAGGSSPGSAAVKTAAELAAERATTASGTTLNPVKTALEAAMNKTGGTEGIATAIEQAAADAPTLAARTAEGVAAAAKAKKLTPEQAKQAMTLLQALSKPGGYANWARILQRLATAGLLHAPDTLTTLPTS